MQLQEDIEKIEAAGITLVAISYDSTDELKNYAEAKNISFPLLSDDDSTVIDAYGIRNTAMDGQTFGRYELTGVPHPGTYILDGEGIIRAKLFLERYQERHTTDALLEAASAVE